MDLASIKAVHEVIECPLGSTGVGVEQKKRLVANACDGVHVRGPVHLKPRHGRQHAGQSSHCRCAACGVGRGISEVVHARGFFCRALERVGATKLALASRKLRVQNGRTPFTVLQPFNCTRVESIAVGVAGAPDFPKGR